MSSHHHISAHIKRKLVILGISTACLAGGFAPAAMAINPQPLPPRVLPPAASTAAVVTAIPAATVEVAGGRK